LGPSISRVRSTALDTWTQENIDIMENLGNGIANKYWEYSLEEEKPNESSSLEVIKQFVYDKYVKKLWAK
jgi:hypothetical protein